MGNQITSREEALAYISGDLVECLVCGKRFSFLPVHINRMHGLSADEYREQFNIPACIPLAGKAYREMQSAKIKRMASDGILDYSHLAQASEAARKSGRGSKRNFDRLTQSTLMKSINASGKAYRRSK